MRDFSMPAVGRFRTDVSVILSKRATVPDLNSGYLRGLYAPILQYLVPCHI